MSPMLMHVHQHRVSHIIALRAIPSGKGVLCYGSGVFLSVCWGKPFRLLRGGGFWMAGDYWGLDFLDWSIFSNFAADF